MEENIPETAELDLRSPVVEVERVEIFDKDRTKLAVVKNVDRSVIEVDFYGASAETEKPDEGGDPPRKSRTVALLTVEPRLVLVGELLR